MNEDLYEVDRETYRVFVKQIKSGCGKVFEEENKDFVFYKIKSVKNDTLWCGRKVFNNNQKEKYYIFEFPTAEESQKYIPRQKIVLETTEQVQKFFDYLKKEQQKND